MPRTLTHPERHTSHRVGWLRAGVLGANDGIVSTSSLLMGVAAGTTATGVLLTTGVAALSAGSLSMAVGEYVSVSSQRDSEQADIAKERHELEKYPDHELDELTAIYESKGLSPVLARQVAVELSKGDLLAVHMAEELGITEETIARPVQASVVSAASFAVGAALPLLAHPGGAGEHTDLGDRRGGADRPRSPGGVRRPAGRGLARTGHGADAGGRGRGHGHHHRHRPPRRRRRRLTSPRSVPRSPVSDR